MQLIFLDIDGVLNSVQSLHYYAHLASKGLLAAESDGSTWEVSGCIHFCPIAASNFRVLLRELPDAKIVVSSSWRKSRMDNVEKLFKEHDLPFDRIIGTTPALWTRRGIEIQKWLDDNAALAPTDFVIIDDDGDMEHLKEKHLVQTNGLLGFTYPEVLQIVARFRQKTTGEVDKEIKLSGG